MDQLNEFKVIGDNNFQSAFGFNELSNETFHQDEHSISAQRRRSYLMEMNDDFDIQQTFTEINWQSSKLTD